MIANRSFRSPIPSAADGTPLASFDVRSEVPTAGESFGVVTAFGEIDLATCGEFSQALHHCANGHTDVVVDLTDVTFMDCSALRVLVPLRRELEARGGRLCLVATRPIVLRLLDLTGVKFELATDGNQAFALLDGSV